MTNNLCKNEIEKKSEKSDTKNLFAIHFYTSVPFFNYTKNAKCEEERNVLVKNYLLEGVETKISASLSLPLN
jgi:hypothetical protein